jgi:hypothetical protein
VVAANGAAEEMMKIGDLPGTMIDKKGNKLGDAMITGCSNVPSNKFNLYSITQALLNKWMLHGNAEAIWLTKDDKKVVFNIKIHKPKGVVFCMNLHPQVQLTEKALVAMTINDAHDRFGHVGEETPKVMAKGLGITLKPGAMVPCEVCTTGKARQKNLPTNAEHEVAKKGKNRIFLDIISIKNKDNKCVYKSNWRIMVDERTELKISDFFDTKNGMVEPTCAKLYKWSQNGIKVKKIQLDNAGENKLLQQRADSKDWKLAIDFEFTSAMTPQQNHLAEIAFATLSNRGRVMMYHANIPNKVKPKVCQDAFQTATKLDGLVLQGRM